MKQEEYKQSQRLLVAVDCIIFGFDGQNLKVLLINRKFQPEKGKWSLMGGFVKQDEGVNAAAARILKQLTGLTDIYMEQLQCFGNVDRDAAGRVISIAYYSLINIRNYSHQIQPEHEAQWFPIGQIPSLIFDHKQMVEAAMQKLQNKAATHPIGFELLPRKFTLPMLRNLYEAIYERPLDKRNFRKKMMALGILEKLNQKEKKSSKKGAYFYTFNYAKYNKLEQREKTFI